MPGFYALSSLWLLFLIPPLILFYFLKLKRPRLVVPSLVLWRKVINDSRVNSPFQRFKRNILLFLQLLLLILLILAAMQPYIRANPDRVQRLPILIDHSASMGALDRRGGQTRLDAAREQVEKIIDNLLPDQEVSLISFSRNARRLTGFTNNKRELRDALDSIRIEDVPSDLEDALRLAQAMSQGAPFEKVMLYSDGNIPADIDFALPFKLEYQRLAPAGPNFAVTALNARRADSDSWDIFAKLDASVGNDARTMASVELLQDGKPVVDPQSIALEAGSAQRLAFRIKAPEATSLELRLKPDEFDSLASDNVAWLDLAPARPLLVFCPPHMRAYRLALASIEGVTVYPNNTSASSSAGYDLLITDQPVDLRDVKARTTVAVGLIPEDAKPLLSVDQKGTTAVDWNRGSSLLQYVELRDLAVIDNPVTAEGKGERDFEQLGYEVVAHGGLGPLILRRAEGGRQTFFFTFHTDRSELPYRIGFPLMVSNMVRVAMEDANLAETQAARTGVLPVMNLTPGRTYSIKGPDQGTREEPADSQGVLAGVPAPLAGRYEISGEGVPSGGGSGSIAVSLLDERESSLGAVESLQFEEVSVTAAGADTKADKPLWPLLAMLGLAVLVIEWWFYQRRPRVPGLSGVGGVPA